MYIYIYVYIYVLYIYDILNFDAMQVDDTGWLRRGFPVHGYPPAIKGVDANFPIQGM